MFAKLCLLFWWIFTKKAHRPFQETLQRNIAWLEQEIHIILRCALVQTQKMWLRFKLLNTQGILNVKLQYFTECHIKFIFLKSHSSEILAINEIYFRGISIIFISLRLKKRLHFTFNVMNVNYISICPARVQLHTNFIIRIK